LTADTCDGYGERILHGFRSSFDLNVSKSRTNRYSSQARDPQNTTKASDGGTFTLKPVVLPSWVKAGLSNRHHDSQGPGRALMPRP
jgi:hypothetical protein